MAFAALDTSQNSRNFVGCMKERGVTAIGRYYTKNRGNSKILTPDEARRLSQAGIKIWPVYQNRHRLPVDFSATKGKQEAEDALDYAKNVIDQPTGSGIYFSADFDASQATFNSADPSAFRGHCCRRCRRQAILIASASMARARYARVFSTPALCS